MFKRAAGATRTFRANAHVRSRTHWVDMIYQSGRKGMRRQPQGDANLCVVPPSARLLCLVEQEDKAIVRILWESRERLHFCRLRGLIANTHTHASTCGTEVYVNLSVYMRLSDRDELRVKQEKDQRPLCQCVTTYEK